MIVRIASAHLAPERVDELISRYRESSLRTMQQQTQGLRHHHVLVDRQSGQVRIIG
jgi:phosphoribosylcarboxyaminoimidazole (NCAIR) mutase